MMRTAWNLAAILLVLSLQALAAHPAPEIEKDWAAQDGLYADEAWRPEAVRRPIDELGEAGKDLAERFDELRRLAPPADDPRWLELYRAACARRRAARLAPHLDKLRRVVFTKHYDLGGSHYAYTEGQSDAQAERHFHPGTSLCLLEMDGPYGAVRTLLDDPKGVIRDPDVSYDGRRILFAWKKSDRQDDYHLYEMAAAGGEVRQLTFGLGFADYEGAYLPGGDIVFNSTRCVQTVDCWWTEVSNLYTCDGQGRYLRRLGYDQVHTNFPTVTPDGRVLYTRWEYNDRGQIYPQGLMQMYPDGTGQTECYGNNSWFPTTILHARAIPGTDKIVCIFTGHHSIQKGWLGLLDPSRGRQENQGAQLIAPVRRTGAVHVDAYGQQGDQFQYPYPLSETALLVTFKPARGAKEARGPFAIYFMTIDGRRELLAWDRKISCNQPVPLAARPEPAPRPRVVDYRRNTGTVCLQDVYAGPGLRGVPRGTVKSLRVVTMEFRAAGIGSNNNSGPAGRALISTPISIRGAWDVKRVLGTTPVYEDGSACFIVPARTPVYFQALDAKGHVVQTMRSWTTLQPGEYQSCVGCHESKNSAPPLIGPTRALSAGPRELRPWQGPPRGFSFEREIQPILDRRCVRCHHGDLKAAPTEEMKPAFSLKGGPGTWSDAYKALANPKVTSWISPQSEPSMLPPYHAGAAKSKLIAILEKGHYEARLAPDEMERLACWIDLLVPCFGDYMEGLDAKSRTKYQHFLDKRRRWEEEEAKNIAAYLNRDAAGG